MDVAFLQSNVDLDNHQNNLHANTHTNHISIFLHTNKILGRVVRAKETGSLL